MFTREMNEEFRQLFKKHQPTEGTLPAKALAFSIMMSERRQALIDLLETHVPHARADRTRLSAELTLLMLAAGHYT